jgi:hypothetical protein
MTQMIEKALSSNQSTAKNKKSIRHAYNPSYSGGRDQEDHSLKPALGK